jgi:hypothetical protein
MAGFKNICLDVFNCLFSGLLLMFQFHPKAKEKRLLVSPNPAGLVLSCLVN